MVIDNCKVTCTCKVVLKEHSRHHPKQLFMGSTMRLACVQRLRHIGNAPEDHSTIFHQHSHHSPVTDIHGKGKTAPDP